MRSHELDEAVTIVRRSPLANLDQLTASDPTRDAETASAMSPHAPVSADDDADDDTDESDDGDDGGCDGDEDDDDDERFVEPFSLLESVVRPPALPTGRVAAGSAVEVIHYRGDQLVDLIRVPAGAVLRSNAAGTIMLRVGERSDTARLRFMQSDHGTVVSHRKWRSLVSLACPSNLSHDHDGSYELTLRPGDFAQLRRAEGGYLIRFVELVIESSTRVGSPGPVGPSRGSRGEPGGALRATLRRRRGVFAILTASGALHLAALALIAVAAPGLTSAADNTTPSDRPTREFALVAPRPEQRPKTLKTSPPPRSKTVTPRVPPRVRTPRSKRVAHSGRATSGSPPPTTSHRARTAARQMLATLSSMRGKLASERSSIASNIAAIRAPGGTVAAFRIAGVLSKLRGGRVSLGVAAADAGTGRHVRRVMGSRTGGLVAIRGTGTRVRGHVRTHPPRLTLSGCFLSRAEIQKVVSRNMGQIQACYERELVHHAGLSGKVVLDWQIDASGRVVSARVMTASLGDRRVQSCLTRAVRRWRFPKPRGGPGVVRVRYPFIFRSGAF